MQDTGRGPGERVLRKGAATRALIVRRALALARKTGLEGLTIGLVADEIKMSKTGVFARFGSRETLQLEVLRLYRAQFEQAVFHPGLHEPSGLPRLAAMFERWVQFESDEFEPGSIYISAAIEYENRPGAMRDALVAMIDDWQAALRYCAQLAIDAGHLRADTDPTQLVYEMYGLILGLHHELRLLRRPGSAQRTLDAFARLMDEHRRACTRPATGAGPARRKQPVAARTAIASC